MFMQEVDDLMIRRFLRARDHDIEKASTLFLKYLSWRRAFVPKGFIQPSEIPNELAQNKLFLQGLDKKGRPISIVLGARHKPNKSLDEFKRMLLLLMCYGVVWSSFIQLNRHPLFLICFSFNFYRFYCLQPRQDMCRVISNTVNHESSYIKYAWPPKVVSFFRLSSLHES